jgi:hypothetical protein
MVAGKNRMVDWDCKEAAERDWVVDSGRDRLGRGRFGRVGFGWWFGFGLVWLRMGWTRLGVPHMDVEVDWREGRVFGCTVALVMLVVGRVVHMMRARGRVVHMMRVRGRVVHMMRVRVVHMMRMMRVMMRVLVLILVVVHTRG